MVSAKSIVGLLLTAASVAEAEWNILNDKRVQDKGVTPVLGRGYSITSNKFKSICLAVNAITDPTSDYDFFLLSIEGNIMDGVTQAFSSGKMRQHTHRKKASTFVEGQHDHMAELQLKAHVTFAVMKSDRYYTSIDEAEVALIAPAVQLLARGNPVQFFQACGPNYIRSIRRNTEVMSIFVYGTMSVDTDSSMDMKITAMVSNPGGGSVNRAKHSRSEKRNSSASGLVIKILASGLSFAATQHAAENGGSLVARNLKDFKNVMDTCFKSMQDPYAGFVKSVELVPWTSNAAFMNVLRIDQPMSRTLYGCYYNEAGETVNQFGETEDCFDGSDGTPATTCGYDANMRELFNENLCQVTGTEDALHKDIRRFNLISNAEFIARLEDRLRHDLEQMQTHRNCIQDLMSFLPEYYEQDLLNHKRPGAGLGFSGPQMQVKTLLHMLIVGNAIEIPASASAYKGSWVGTGVQDENNFIYMRRLVLFTDYLEGYLEPCMLALGETTYGVSMGAMQLYHWTAVSECNRIMCTLPNSLMVNGACIRPTFTSAQDIRELVYLNVRLEEYCPATLSGWVGGLIARPA